MLTTVQQTSLGAMGKYSCPCVLLGSNGGRASRRAVLAIRVPCANGSDGASPSISTTGKSTCPCHPMLLAFLVLLSCSTVHAAPRVYVTNERSGDVTVIDTATNKVIA